ncbi:MAG: hypothetical protein A3A58_03650 [Candidatus Blackburnbacteria bacterium RIFCSPLOWO2_01_FULL_41_27]|uniref:Transposase IS200-like domain-containing protein n=2 Tax=Candidatus Blackburniibacteriota TaxID=1817898 RepID=A0A1G1V5K9_9BACT|nr:MAG: hypothetical protein A3F61_01155 [Candidatus Blackburnbacteria bacterium RIFCSPHIGHO2_12_FULL_41_13b]OGY13922.1 MAG: hypothetical protein A3A58_03650 [Candidatus Blackburnbacteria bacterium RIFCSPLOWO2_01_FULL_41_27]
MPAKNSIREYLVEGRYHIYNRGVDKRTIFIDDQDYRVFLHILKILLSKPELDEHPLTEITGFIPVRLRLITDTLYKEIDLIAYCLMPNHFHLFIKQHTINGISKLLSRLTISYVMYFNKKYERQGVLFQGEFKAVLVKDEPYLLHLSRYIHLNPSELTGGAPVNRYPYSSYANYLGEKNSEWVRPQEILAYFDNTKRLGLINSLSYKNFVEEFEVDSIEVLGGLTLE